MSWINQKVKIFILYVIMWLGLAGIPYSAFSAIFVITVPIVTIGIVNLLKLSYTDHLVNTFSYKTVNYFFWLLQEIISSAIAVITIIWSKNITIRPVVKIVKSNQTNTIGSVVYANSITLTPGTLTMNIDNQFLLVHSIDSTFIADDLSLNTMEQKIIQSLS